MNKICNWGMLQIHCLKFSLPSNSVHQFEVLALLLNYWSTPGRQHAGFSCQRSTVRTPKPAVFISVDGDSLYLSLSKKPVVPPASAVHYKLGSVLFGVVLRRMHYGSILSRSNPEQSWTGPLYKMISDNRFFARISSDNKIYFIQTYHIICKPLKTNFYGVHIRNPNTNNVNFARE